MAVHLFEGDKIIGQMELGYLRGDESVGYVNLYYLEPGSRGKGYGDFLDRYAIKFFQSKNINSARLSVSPTNHSALKFYQKMGWKDQGPREGMPEVHWMEKQFPLP